MPSGSEHFRGQGDARLEGVGGVHEDTLHAKGSKMPHNKEIDSGLRICYVYDAYHEELVTAAGQGGGNTHPTRTGP